MFLFIFKKNSLGKENWKIAPRRGIFCKNMPAFVNERSWGVGVYVEMDLKIVYFLLKKHTFFAIYLICFFLGSFLIHGWMLSLLIPLPLCQHLTSPSPLSADVICEPSLTLWSILITLRSQIKVSWKIIQWIIKAPSPCYKRAGWKCQGFFLE